MKIELIIAGILLIPMLALTIDKFFLKKNPFFCNFIGWHHNVTHTGNDGCSNHGTCNRCNKKVLQDSNGDWF